MNWCLISITEAMRRVVRQGLVLIFVCAITTGVPAQQLSRPVGEPPTGKNSSTFKEKQGPAGKAAEAVSTSAETAPARRAGGADIPAHVITVVHRLSGWKMFAWLAATGTEMVDGNELMLADGVHTNIVAGCVLDDGRTVIARLSQAETEALTLLPDFFTQNGRSEAADMIVVRRDGVRFKAAFIGLDSSTGLSLLQIAEPILPPALRDASTAALTEGRAVRLFAPERAQRRESLRDEGLVYLRMSEAEGKLLSVRRARSGKAIEAAVGASRLSAAWAGAVATNESGTLLGIAEQAGADEIRLIPAETIKGAAARVLARRATVPQPWLGARGDAVALAPLELFMSSGWPQKEAQALASKRQGVLLTAVAPGTPAAVADLRAGDVVARISEQEVRGVEDFSFILKQAGGGSTVNFTVLRPQMNAPLDVIVRLSESLKPARATAEAEARALEIIARAQASKAREMLTAARAAAIEARLSGIEARILEAEAQVAEAAARVVEAEAREAQATARVDDVRATAQGEVFVKPLLPLGVKAIALSPKSAARFKAPKGLLVIAVLPQSVAAQSGVQAGDVIEAVNNQALPGIAALRELSLSTRANVALSILRDGQRRTLTLANRSDPK